MTWRQTRSLLLGHASINTTERYDNQNLENLQAEVPKIESGKTFDRNVGNDTKDRVDDRDKLSSFFQFRRKSRRSTIRKSIQRPHLTLKTPMIQGIGWLLGRFPQLVAAGPGSPRKGMKIVASAEWRRWERRGRD